MLRRYPKDCSRLLATKTQHHRGSIATSGNIADRHLRLHERRCCLPRTRFQTLEGKQMTTAQLKPQGGDVVLCPDGSHFAAGVVAVTALDGMITQTPATLVGASCVRTSAYTRRARATRLHRVAMAPKTSGTSRMGRLGKCTFHRVGHAGYLHMIVGECDPRVRPHEAKPVPYPEGDFAYCESRRRLRRAASVRRPDHASTAAFLLTVAVAPRGNGRSAAALRPRRAQHLEASE